MALRIPHFKMLTISGNLITFRITLEHFVLFLELIFMAKFVIIPGKIPLARGRVKSSSKNSRGLPNAPHPPLGSFYPNINPWAKKNNINEFDLKKDLFQDGASAALILILTEKLTKLASTQIKSRDQNSLNPTIKL